jgi:hypothetical protein
MNISITDELLNGTITNEFTIQFKSDQVTVEHIIAERVRIEVENYNEKLPTYFNGLVEPLEAEKSLNGYKLKKNQKIDVEKQIYVALDAFQKNGFFVLIDHLQVENLNETIQLKSSTSISFLKLTPLVGG